jgi:hypothetical protein
MDNIPGPDIIIQKLSFRWLITPRMSYTTIILLNNPVGGGFGDQYNQPDKLTYQIDNWTGH